MLKLLDKSAHCSICGELMAGGEPFRWAEKQLGAGSRVSSGYRTVIRPAHVSENCIGQKYEREQKLKQANTCAGAIKKLREVGADDDALEQVRALYVAQLAYAEFAQIVQHA